MNKLAIVIPAFKGKYFRKTLESISNQSCKEFALYIGDDASPDDLKSIVDLNCSHTPVVYKRFESNLGGRDLVAHWERCIDMTSDEEWIWLFSDDDVMSEDCVEGFYEILEKYDKESAICKVFRYNLFITDADLSVLQKYETPAEFSVEYFLQSYFITHNLRNRAVEFIFSKTVYIENNRFVNFPLGWGSDTATMLKFGQSSGFVTIQKGDVFWRDSAYNISSKSDAKINEQKPFAISLFLIWVIDFIRVYGGSKFHKKLIYNILYFLPSLPSLSRINEKYKKKDKLYYEILVWVVFIKIKRLLRIHKIKYMVLQIKNSGSPVPRSYK
jgi:glycosyltransferase involved in cell wall biosynthesis